MKTLFAINAGWIVLGLLTAAGLAAAADPPAKPEDKKEEKKEEPKKDEKKEETPATSEELINSCVWRGIGRWEEAAAPEIDLKPYIELLSKDDNPAVRRRAILFLAKLKSKAADAIPSLYEVALRKEEDREVKALAFETLLRFTNEERIQMLLKALASKDNKEGVRQRLLACKALAYYPTNEDAYKGLEAALTDPDPEVRTEAARSLDAIERVIAKTIHIRLDPAKLLAQQLTEADLLRRLEQVQSQLQGQLKVQRLSPNLIECSLPPTSKGSLQAFDGITLTTRGKQPVRIRDVATVQFIIPVKGEGEGAEKKDK